MSGRVLLPSVVTPSHYSLELSPDLETLEFSCTEEITVEVHDAVNQITLHQKEIYIVSAFFKSGGAETVPIGVEEIIYNKKANTVKFMFEQLLPVGPAVFT